VADERAGDFSQVDAKKKGAHAQAETLVELNANLKEVVEMLLESGEPSVEAEFIGTQR